MAVGHQAPIRYILCPGVSSAGLAAHWQSGNPSLITGKICLLRLSHSEKTGGCEGRNISERELETAVLTTLQSEIKLILDVDRALGQVEALAWERREIMRLEAAISAQEAEIAKYRTLKTSVYEDLRDGLITQDEFLHMKQDFSERISFIEDDISGLKTELDAVRAGLVNQTGWLAQFRQYRNLAKLTRTVVVNLIDKIHIYPDKRLPSPCFARTN